MVAAMYEVYNIFHLFLKESFWDIAIVQWILALDADNLSSNSSIQYSSLTMLRVIPVYKAKHCCKWAQSITKQESFII